MRRTLIALALLAIGVIAGTGLVSAEIDGNTVNACINNTNYVLRLRPTAGCVTGETPVTWNVTGPTGPQGPAGSPDTPQQVLDKIVQVDGDGSGLDASLLDGLNSTQFLRNNGKAVDADLVDGINSTGFARRRTNASGTIGLSAIGANTCKDVTFNLGGLQPGDVVLLNVKEGDTLPAGLTMSELGVPAAGQLTVRICNGTNTASVADNSIGVRWYIFRSF